MGGVGVEESEGKETNVRKLRKVFSPHIPSVRCGNRCLHVHRLCVYCPYLRRSKCLR